MIGKEASRFNSASRPRGEILPTHTKRVEHRGKLMQILDTETRKTTEGSGLLPYRACAQLLSSPSARA